MRVQRQRQGQLYITLYLTSRSRVEESERPDLLVPHDFNVSAPDPEV